MNIMASGPITWWQIGGETVTAFIFGLQNHCRWWLQPWRLLLGRKAMTNLDTTLKSRDIALPTKTMVFPVVMYGCESWTIKKSEHWRTGAFKLWCWRRLVVMYGCESWTIKKSEHWRTGAFELWCWRRLFRVSWTARRSNRFILKETSPEYSLEGLKLKLKL